MMPVKFAGMMLPLIRPFYQAQRHAGNFSIHAFRISGENPPTLPWAGKLPS